MELPRSEPCERVDRFFRALLGPKGGPLVVSRRRGVFRGLQIAIGLSQPVWRSIRHLSDLPGGTLAVNFLRSSLRFSSFNRVDMEKTSSASRALPTF